MAAALAGQAAAPAPISGSATTIRQPDLRTEGRCA